MLGSRSTLAPRKKNRINKPFLQQHQAHQFVCNRARECIHLQLRNAGSFPCHFLQSGCFICLKISKVDLLIVRLSVVGICRDMFAYFSSEPYILTKKIIKIDTLPCSSSSCGLGWSSCLRFLVTVPVPRCAGSTAGVQPPGKLAGAKGCGWVKEEKSTPFSSQCAVRFKAIVLFCLGWSN